MKEGDPFAKAAISEEMDRLVLLYRNNGFMRFGREELIGLWDTLDISLLQPSLDPLEQLELLQKLKERRENPTANLEIRLRQLARLEAIKIEQELKGLREDQKKLEEILGSPAALRRLMVREIEQDTKTFGDDRRTLLPPDKRPVVEVKTVSYTHLTLPTI